MELPFPSEQPRTGCENERRGIPVFVSRSDTCFIETITNTTMAAEKIFTKPGLSPSRPWNEIVLYKVKKILTSLDLTHRPGNGIKTLHHLLHGKF